MLKKLLPCLFLLFFSACGPASSSPSPTPDLASLVARELTRVARLQPTSPAFTPAPTDTPLPGSSDPLVVVYAQAGNLWRWQAGQAQQLTFSGQDDQPRISDDGRVVAFLRGGELFSIQANGAGEQRLVSAAYSSGNGGRVFNFRFLPGGRQLFFDLAAPDFPLQDLHWVDTSAHTAVPMRVLQPGQGGTRWVFSPNGQWIAFSQAGSIRLLNLPTLAVHEAHKFKQAGAADPGLRWLGNSSGLYATLPAVSAGGKAHYYFIPLQGKAAKLAEFASVPLTDGAPLIAPNGAQFAYLQRAKAADEIHVMDASTADRVYASGPGLRLWAWTPDSQQVIYQTLENGSLWRAGPQGGPLHLLTSASLRELRWLTPTRLLYLDETGLHLLDFPQSITLLAEAVTAFDFSVP